MFNKRSFLSAAVGACLCVGAAQSTSAQLVSQLGVLDLAANGGINPNTGLAWQAGDQYRLAFYTAGTISGESDDPAVYDAFATSEAAQNAALVGISFTAMVWVNTDESLPQAADFGNIQPGESPLSSPVIRSGTDAQDTADQGGLGVPVYAMDGMTAIARNNADIYNSWSNPFEDAPGVVNSAGTGNNVLRIDTGNINSSPHYSPFLDQFGAGDSGAVHGATVWTGGFGGPVNPLGNSVDPDTQTRASHGSSNANRTGRVWNRFNSGTGSNYSVYAISELLTVMDGGPALPGDTDGDGDIDDSDLGTAFSNYTGPLAPGTGGKTAADGDTDGDGDVDDSDLGTAFSGYTGPLGPASVPEPTSLALLGLGGLLIARRRRA
ncbi:MAG: PEP-CTERM sorting domain-containing protein [Phycisphaeraceae bacterium]